MKNYANNITGIMKCVKDCVQQAYDKGYKEGVAEVKDREDVAYDKGYKQGMAESEVEVKDADHIWYKGNQYISLKRFLEANKKKPCVDEIKVGDEVICAGTGTRKLVLKVINVKGVLRYMCFSDESGYSTENENFPPKKTGRHFDIDKILEQMKEVDK